MEKLQAALAKARDKREGAVTPRHGGPELSARGKARNRAADDALGDRWAALADADPSDRRMKQARIVTGDAGTESMHFDILRTKLLLEMRRNNWTRIAITSATPGCGKTTVACNLIAGLGRQPEVRGMLFDLDLRRPAIARFFGLKPQRGMVELFDGSATFDEVGVRLSENTALAMTPRAVPDPARLLLRDQTAITLDRIQADYRPDVMLFDLPPVLVSDEARGFLKLVDAAIIVAGAESTTMSQVDECEREVAEYTKVAGIVLNKCRFMEQGYGYSY